MDMGIEVDRIRQDEAWATCPGPHEAFVGKADRHASWSINLETGEHNCFSCGWGGPYIVLVKWIFDWDKDEAAAEAWVRKHGGIEVAKKKLRGQQAYARKQAEPVSEADLALFTSPPRSALLNKDVDRTSCEEFGVLWDPEHESWVFPVREPYTDKLMGWQSKNKRIFINHPENLEKSVTLFGFNLLLKQPRPRTAYLYESPVDAVHLHTYGLDGPVSSYGVHVSDAQMNLLVDEVDTLYVCLDNDGAGRRMERKIWEDWRGQFRKMYFTNYEGIREKDHGEMRISDVEWSLNNAISAVRYRP